MSADTEYPTTKVIIKSLGGVVVEQHDQEYLARIPINAHDSPVGKLAALASLIGSNGLAGSEVVNEYITGLGFTACLTSHLKFVLKEVEAKRLTWGDALKVLQTPVNQDLIYRVVIKPMALKHLNTFMSDGISHGYGFAWADRDTIIVDRFLPGDFMPEINDLPQVQWTTSDSGFISGFQKPLAGGWQLLLCPGNSKLVLGESTVPMAGLSVNVHKEYKVSFSAPGVF